MSLSYEIVRRSAKGWDAVPAVTLTHQRWLAPCAIAARAQACHDGESLFVRMEAQEKDIRATLTGPLEPVCQDSCLEFFFAPDPADGRYFNFEWNPLGTLYFGFGLGRGSRVRQAPEDAQALLSPRPFETAQGWGIEFRIPASLIRLYMPCFTLSGEAAGNFYKCGDRTRTPHYLAWAPLSSDAPDFHRRGDFGRLVLE